MTKVNANLVERHRHASLYLTFYSSTRWVRRVREARTERERERGEETKTLMWGRRAEQHPVTKQLLCQKARRTQNTRSSTHARRVNKEEGGGGAMLPRMTAAY